MILLSNTGYWSTGISLRWSERCGTRGGVPHSGWGGRVDYVDDGFCDDDPDAGQVSTEGVLRTRYLVRDGDKASGLRVAIDTLIADAAALGITFREPTLYYDGDGENENWPAPVGWRELLSAEAGRLGWQCPYDKTRTES